MIARRWLLAAFLLASTAAQAHDWYPLACCSEEG